MTAPGNMRTGGQALVAALKINHVDLVFSVPGESFLAVLDALHDVRDSLRLITCRQEGGAANMAAAYGKITGRPGICFVTRGPGAANASVGLHTALQDSAPMILFIGQVGRAQLEREAFQEIDFRRMFGQMAKWVGQIDDAARIPEYINRAFATATSGRPGPVVLALPEDMLREAANTADAAPAKAATPSPSAGEIVELRHELEQAQRPILIYGGPTWNQQTADRLHRFAADSMLPVAASFRCQSYFDNTHACYIGDLGVGPNPKLAQRVRDADLIVAVGPRLGEITTDGYSLLEVPVPRQRLVHIHPGAEELGRVYQPNLGINAAISAFAEMLSDWEPIAAAPWHAWTAAARQDYLEYSAPRPMPGRLDLAQVMAWLNETLPEDAIITTGAGNFTAWPNRFYRYRKFMTLVGPTSGAMGFGVPAAVAAKAMFPERMVVSFSGDGCFLMNGQELATAVQYGINTVNIVINNGMYGTIRMHQERSYPGRVSGTDLINPDFAALARAYGAFGEVVETTDEFAPAFERAATAGRPALLELRIDPQAINPNTTLDALRAAASKA